MSKTKILLATRAALLILAASLILPHARKLRKEMERKKCNMGDEDTRQDDHIYTHRDITTALERTLDFKKSEAKKDNRENKIKRKIELVVAAVVAITAIINVLLWLSQREANRINMQNMIESSRAWIASTKVDFENFPSSGPITVRITFENVGHSPATNEVHIGNAVTAPLSGQPLVSWNDIPIWKTFKDQVGSVTKCISITPSLDGDVIFQGNQEFPRSIDIKTKNGVDAAEIRSGHQLLVIFGCYAYRTMGSDHVTYFCYYPHPVSDDVKGAWIWGTCPVWHYAN